MLPLQMQFTRELVRHELRLPHHELFRMELWLRQ